MHRIPLGLCAAALLAGPAAAVELSVHYLRQDVPLPPTLSNLDPQPEDLGMAGARVGLDDNTTTGKFLGHTYTLEITEVAEGEDLLAAARAALAETPYLLVDAPAADLLAIADMPEAAEALIFNVAAADVALRDAECRANVLHTLPSDAMRTDALAQLLVLKR